MLIDDEGRNYTAAEYEQQRTEPGFRQPRRISLNVPGANGLNTSGLPVRGTPPGA
jgi:hypothetical protein